MLLDVVYVCIYATITDQHSKVTEVVEVPDQDVVEKEDRDDAQVIRILPGTLRELNCSIPLSSGNNTFQVLQLISCDTSTLSNLTHHPDPLTTTIVAITPTYKRRTQKSDLVSLCQTIMNVPNILWIVVEDSHSRTSLVGNVLQHCKVKSVHLNAVTSKESKKASQRGVEQRNAGLDWARRYCKENCRSRCNSVVYFMDDDNKYDLRLFEQVHMCVHSCYRWLMLLGYFLQMRRTKRVSVFPVAFSGGLAFEGPICENGKAVDWQAVWQSKERYIVYVMLIL